MTEKKPNSLILKTVRLVFEAPALKADVYTYK